MKVSFLGRGMLGSLLWTGMNEVISASLFLDIGQRQRGLHDPPDLGRAHRGVAQHSPPAGEYRHRALADAP